MPRTLSLALSCFLLPATLAAQIRIFDDYTITAPERWKRGPETRTSVELFVPLSHTPPTEPQNPNDPKPSVVIGADAGILILIERHRDHDAAVRRLSQIAAERDEPVTPLTISGWPAIERRYRDRYPRPGEDEDEGANRIAWFTTSAVAASSVVLRFDAMLAPDADASLADEALAIARSLTAPGGSAERALRELATVARARRRAPMPPRLATASGERVAKHDGPGVAAFTQEGNGEIEVAASSDGRNVVLATNSGYSYSMDSGARWTRGGPTPCGAGLAVCDGDPSLAAGPMNRFYYGWIGGTTRTSPGNGVSRSDDGGRTFTRAGLSVECPGVTRCSVADQPHIAVDRFNPGARGDRVYNVWRNFSGMVGAHLVCSSDSGVTWGAPVAVGASVNFVFARVSRRVLPPSTVRFATVDVEFFAADFGLGTAFTSIGSEPLTLLSTELSRITASHAWTVDPASSAHLCLAAQLSGPDGDDFALPSLDGLAPGPSDPLILIDNNKAQRNLAETAGSAMGGGTEMFAVIENAEKETRPMEIAIRWPADVQISGSVAIVGGASVKLDGQKSARIDAGTLKPHERRWLKFSALPKSEKPVFVDFYEEDGSNGFTIAYAAAPIQTVARRNMLFFADVLTRLAVLEKNADAKELAEDARKLATKQGTLSAGAYTAWLKTHRTAIARIVAAHLKNASDPFDINGALASLTKTLDAKDADRASAAHNALGERLDAHLTMLVRQ